MKKYFNIPFEFDHQKLEQTIISSSINSKGYCCFVDSNMLVESFIDKREIIHNVLNGSIVNSCDGSYIALLASIVHKRKLRAYNGPEFFEKLIYSDAKQCIIGNTKTVFEKVKAKVESVNGKSDLIYISLPFLSVENFNYKEIANEINKQMPRYIWVSLGAPKQEIFMHKLLPLIDKGVMLGVGAALNYFSGEIKDIPEWATKNKLIWLFRVFTEPKKQIQRVFKIVKYYPAIFLEERRSIRNQTN